VFDTELQARQIVADRYSELLQDLAKDTSLMLPYIEKNNSSVWAQYTIQLDCRDRARKRLSSAGIPTAVHYPLVLSEQPAIKQKGVNCPNSVALSQRVMSLPMHPYLDSNIQQRIVDELGKGLY
jgi:UDP-2-acetamido-2-deoxy-ribo-hexuluronate aminotransferase